MQPHLLHAIAAAAGTPCYVYSQERIEENYRTLHDAFKQANHGHAVALHYAIKANSNLEILKLLRALGAGFDVVSGGELAAVLKIGAHPEHIVFAGVGKRDEELAAAVEHNIAWIVVESAGELRVLSDIAHMRQARARVALRINPGIDPKTHAYLATGKAGSKFGVSPADALALIAGRAAYPGVRIEGLHVHNGSTITDTSVFAESARVMIDLLARCRAAGARITHLDMGGGFGVAYQPGQPAADITGIAGALTALARSADVTLQIEPGRYIVADSCVLLARVLYTKEMGETRYAIVDAAMNDLIRPALYGALHQIKRVPARDGDMAEGELSYEVVGPVCESGDFLGHQVRLPALVRGDLLAIHHAGAYGRSMASNYNLRPRAAEVLTHGGQWRVIRERETIEQIL